MLLVESTEQSKGETRDGACATIAAISSVLLRSESLPARTPHSFTRDTPLFKLSNLSWLFLIMAPKQDSTCERDLRMVV